ncbi:MAG: SCO family protein [Rhodospirillales bacterium]
MIRRITLKTAALLAALSIAIAAAEAHHPGHRLDEVMGSKEKYFQAVGKEAPAFTLKTADNKIVTLADFRGTVVVLQFIYASCPDVCPLHADLFARVQNMVNRTPMKSRVRFLSVTTDPKRDTAETLEAYGAAHGLDPANWAFLTKAPDAPEDATRRLAARYGHKFTKVGEDYQSHGVVTHVIDRGGVWRANFHGLRFDPLNLVLYINGLTHAAGPDKAPKGIE